MPRRRSSEDIFDEHNFCSCARIKTLCVRFWSNKFWRNVKLCYTFIILIDTVTVMCKWAYLMTRDEDFRLAIHAAEKVLYPNWLAHIIVNGLYFWYGIMDEYIWAMRMYVFTNKVQVVFLNILLLVQLIIWLEYGHESPWTDISLIWTVSLMVAITIWHPIVIYIAWAYESGIRAKRRSEDDDDDDEEEETTCREICEDFCEDKFWCKVKLLCLFVLLLNVLFIAYKFYYLVSTSAAYRARIHVAEKILYPFWYSSCLICILFVQYGIFEEYQWALDMFEINTFIEWTFLDLLLLAELIAVSKHGTEAPWNQLTIGMTIARLVVVTLWSALMMYLCQSFERGLREKWEDRTPTLAQTFCPCPCRKS